LKRRKPRLLSGVPRMWNRFCCHGEIAIARRSSRSNE
jgi:hypothetical protein